MPLSLNLPLGYRLAAQSFVNKRMNVRLTTNVPFKDADVAKLAFAIFSQTLKEFREFYPKGDAPFTKLVVVIDRVKVDGSGRETFVGEVRVLRMEVRGTRQRDEPSSFRASEFALTADAPERSAISEAILAAPTRHLIVDIKRRSYGFISVSGPSNIEFASVGGLTDDGG